MSSWSELNAAGPDAAEPNAAGPAPPDAHRTWRPDRPTDLVRTLSCLRRGGSDPTHRQFADGTVWRTFATPQGAAALRLTRRRPPDPAVDAVAWGPGARWAVDAVPALLGGHDDPTGFVPAHPVVSRAARRLPGLRIGRTGLVLDALVPAVLEQKVTGAQARTAWAYLVRRFGTPAPGPAPAGMRVAPDVATWLAVPSWEWHRAGVEGVRARTVRAACTVAARLEEGTALSAEAAHRRLRSVPGIGPWTAAEVAQRAWGDADAVSVGDYHIPSLVGWALAGRPVDDAGMLELLEAYRPHRHRVVRLLELTFRTPRFGPRVPIADYRAM